MNGTQLHLLDDYHTSYRELDTLYLSVSRLADIAPGVVLSWTEISRLGRLALCWELCSFTNGVPRIIPAQERTTPGAISIGL